ncbi:MAG: exo-beta-N-acetylmuramidase NamZ family protein [Bacteroidales bacterium]
MRKFFLLFVAIILSFPLFASHKVKPGVEVLRDQQFKLLEGKRVGLITNPTGVDRNLKSTIDILNEAPNVKLVALFGPEHGVRGDVYAGDKVDNAKDEKTGLPVYSLYGKTRKPTDEMLKGIDVLVYDIQDIGCRSFTYISTLGLAMEAAAKNGIEVVVLDRPNPLGGKKVEGNLVEDGYTSFVSQFKIPYIYGLTCGELAKMLNEEGLIKGKCKLSVVPMKGWNRDMKYTETGLQWIAASPHIPHPHSSDFYPVSGILGELGIISIGVGYTLPFQLFATDSIPADKLADNLNALGLPGVHFRPIHLKPFYSVGQGKKYQGVQVHLTDYDKASLSDIQFYVMQEMYKLNPNMKFFDLAAKGRNNMWDKVCGTNQIRLRLAKNYSVDDIKSYWHKDDDSFKKRSRKYWLYE